MNFVLQSASALVLLGGLCACSGSGNDNPWFPLHSGETQVYRVTQQGEELEPEALWRFEVSGPWDWDGKAVMTRHHSAGVSYFFESDDKGVRRIATRLDTDRETQAEAEPIWVLKAPYAVGTEWTTSTVPYLIKRRNDYPRELKLTHRVPMLWRIEAVDDSVKLESGETHSPCLRVLGQARLNLYTDPVNGFSDVPLTSREWYCQGKGLVKFEREEKVSGSFLTGGTLKAEWTP